MVGGGVKSQHELQSTLQGQRRLAEGTAKEGHGDVWPPPPQPGKWKIYCPRVGSGLKLARTQLSKRFLLETDN